MVSVVYTMTNIVTYFKMQGVYTKTYFCTLVDVACAHVMITKVGKSIDSPFTTQSLFLYVPVMTLCPNDLTILSHYHERMYEYQFLHEVVRMHATLAL